MQLPSDRADYSKSLEMIDPDTGEVRVVKVHNEKGQELPDPVPMAPPLGYEKPLSMFDIQRAQIRAEHHRLRQLELEQLEETVDEANDFDVEHDLEDQPSLYEEKFDPVDFEVRSRLRQAEFREKYNERVDGLPEQQRSLLNGDNLGKPFERGKEVAGDDRGGSDRKSQQKRGKEPAAPVQGSVSAGSGSDKGDPAED